MDPSIVKSVALASLFERAAKRAFDIATATVSLILFSPIFLLASIAIKIDSHGNILCRQLRYGYDNRTFQLLKFRTTMATPGGRDTSLVTRVGRAVRRTGIERLPQLINVLRGEMSIVGPSPCAAPPNLEDISLIQERHAAKPGIIGWAEINGCWRENDNREVSGRRIDYDLYYIKNWSLLFDIKIMLIALFSMSSYLDR
jgi:putative colanic acid biosynthesis UDP-glucose lipid carrier transferase